MTGKDMKELISTGTCPNCKGALGNRNRVGDTVIVGDCDPCNIVWCSSAMTTPHQITAGPKWNPRT